MTDTTPTPRERVARAYATDHDRAALARVAAAHDPAQDAEADRLRAIGQTVPLSAVQRMALGYQVGQRAAVEAVATTSTTDPEGARA